MKKDHINKKKTSLPEIHKTGLKRFSAIQDAERDQREKSVEDRTFCDTEDGQWDDNAKTKRRNRPRYTINKVAPIIDQVTGDQKQVETSAKVRPLKDGASKNVAKTFQGIIRSIEQQSQAKNIYDNSFEETTKGGYGGWRIITKFNEDDIFKQDILLEGIDSADTSLFFGSSKKYDKRDATHAFLVTSIDREEFKFSYPNAKITDFDVDIYNNTTCKNWFDGNQMMIAEYWVKEPYNTEMGLLSDGRVIDLKEEDPALDELMKQGIEVLKRRKVESHKVVMYKMNGAEVFEGPTEFASKYIPLIPEFGHVSKIEKKTYVRGMIRFAKDSNRIYNYLVSTDIETQALTPKDPYWYTPKQADGHKTKYENFATQNSPFMPFNADPDNPGPPSRTGSPSANVAAIEAIRRASLDIDAAMGFFGPAKGDAPQMLSEKSVIAQAEKGDRGVYIFQDNLLKSKQYCYDILIDMIPRIYDTSQQIRILGDDGNSNMVEINQTVRDEQGKEDVIVNDLSQGKYEVVATTGPAFATKRMETTDQLIKLAEAIPIFADYVPDLVAKNIDINESDEMFSRIRSAMVQAGTVEPTEEEVEELGLNQPKPLSEAEQTLNDNVLMQSEKLQSDIELNDEKADTERQNRILKATQTYKEMLESFKIQKELGFVNGISEQQLLDAQQGIIQIAQDGSVEVEEGPEEQTEQQQLTPNQL